MSDKTTTAAAHGDAASEAGRRVFSAFKRAVETGDTAPLAEMLTEDCRFTAPLPFDEWRGEQRGRERVVEMINFERERMGLRVTFTLGAITVQGNTVGIEYRVEGRNGGGAYRNRNAIFFDIEGDKVSGFREYTGDVDPKAVASLADQA